VLFLICLFALVLWVRSYSRGEDIGINTTYHRYFIRTGGGEVGFEWSLYNTPVNESAFQWDLYPRRTKSPYMLRRDTFLLRRGFSFSQSTMPRVGVSNALMIPMWLLVLSFLLPALIALRLGRWMRQGVAIFCGEGYEIGGSAFDGKEAAWIATHLSVS
jgi:hypothetical protein